MSHSPRDGVPMLDHVLATTGCKAHGAAKNEPCWHLYSDNDAPRRAVCDRRARAAGCVGKPTLHMAQRARPPARPFVAANDLDNRLRGGIR